MKAGQSESYPSMSGQFDLDWLQLICAWIWVQMIFDCPETLSHVFWTFVWPIEEVSLSLDLRKLIECRIPVHVWTFQVWTPLTCLLAEFSSLQSWIDLKAWKHSEYVFLENSPSFDLQSWVQCNKWGPCLSIVNLLDMGLISTILAFFCVSNNSRIFLEPSLSMESVPCSLTPTLKKLECKSLYSPLCSSCLLPVLLRAIVIFCVPTSSSMGTVIHPLYGYG